MRRGNTRQRLKDKEVRNKIYVSNCVQILNIYFCSFTRERTNVYTHIYKFEQLIVQKEINLSAPGKDHIILTKYKQVYLTNIIIRHLSKHLPEKLKIISNTSKAMEKS